MNFPALSNPGTAQLSHGQTQMSEVALPQHAIAATDPQFPTEDAEIEELGAGLLVGKVHRHGGERPEPEDAERDVDARCPLGCELGRSVLVVGKGSGLSRAKQAKCPLMDPVKRP